MTADIRAIDYATPRRPPRKLTLERSADAVTVLFAVAPRWVYFAPIVVYFASGTSTIVERALILHMMWSFLHTAGFSPNSEETAFFRHFVITTTLATTVTVLFWWLSAAYLLRLYLRWGRLPRTLTATAQGLTYSHLGWWRMKNRNWQASQITSIELKPVRGNLTWWRTVAELSIRFRTGRSRRFRLSSRDPQLPRQIAEALRSILKIAPPSVSQKSL